MSDFDPKKFVEDNKDTDFDAADFVKKNQQQAPQYEQPSFGRRLYEQGVVIPVRAARNLMPYGESLQRTMVDPVAAALQGKTMAEKQKEREEYDAYLRSVYPGQLEGAQMGVDVLGALYKPTAVQATEPLAAQAVEHPESLGLNLETGMSTLPIGLSGLMKIPGAIAKGVGFIKSRPEARPSMRKYEANPELYDAYEAQTSGQPREHMVRSIQEDLNLKQTDKDIRLQAEKDAMEQARADRSEAAREMSMSKRDIDYQRRNAYEDARQSLRIGAEEGDAAKRIVGELQNNYKKTANVRNDLLEQQGTVHDVIVIDDMFQDAIDNTTDPSQVASLQRAQQRVKDRAVETTGDETAITPKAFNDLRMYLQAQVVNWGKHMTPADRGFHSIARAINDDLDFNIQGNEQLRAKIRQQTLDYNDAVDLFGDDYNIAQLKSSLKDPQKLAVIERISANNPDTPTLADVKAKLTAMDAIEESRRRGIHPVVPAEQNLAAAEAERTAAIRRYLESRNKKAEIAKERLPFTSAQTESTINTAMVANPMHPRVNQTDALAKYAKTFPEGEDSFWDMYDKNKVLRDLSTLDQAQGSRMTNLGKSVGGAIGGGMTYMSGGSLPETGFAAAAGAAVGAALDFNASKVYRSGFKMDRAQEGIRRTVNAATAATVKQLQARYGEQATQTAMNSGIPIDKLAGTRYEAPLMKTLQEDPRKAAVVHYVSYQNDPEYARLVGGGEG